MSLLRRRITFPMFTGILAIALGCGDEPAGPGDTPIEPQVASVEISAATAPEVQVGGTLQLSVEVRDATGSVLSGEAVQWSSGEPSIATIDNAGLVAGVGEVDADELTATGFAVNPSQLISPPTPLAAR